MHLLVTDTGGISCSTVAFLCILVACDGNADARVRQERQGNGGANPPSSRGQQRAPAKVSAIAHFIMY